MREIYIQTPWLDEHKNPRTEYFYESASEEEGTSSVKNIYPYGLQQNSNLVEIVFHNGKKKYFNGMPYEMTERKK